MIPPVWLRLPCFLAVVSVCFAGSEFRRVCRRYELDVGIQRAPWEREATHTCLPGPPNGRCFIQGNIYSNKTYNIIHEKTMHSQIKMLIGFFVKYCYGYCSIFVSVRWKSKTWYRYMYLMILIKSTTSEFENRNLKFYEREIGRQMFTYF